MNENVIWSTASAGIQLRENEVHIWRARLEVSPTVRERFSALLSLGEQERVARLLSQGIATVSP